MQFEDLQSKWQQHDHASRDHWDLDRISKEVEQQHQMLEKELWRRDVNEVMAAVLVAIFFSLTGVWMQEWTLFVCAAGGAAVGLFFVVDRWRWRRRSMGASHGLKSSIELALAQVEHQIWLLKNIVWWYLLPPGVGVVLFLGSTFRQSLGKGIEEQWVIAAVGLICIVFFWYAYRVNQREVRATLEPRRDELKNLLESIEK